MKNKYQKTMIACYLGFITQAITANFAPLLFLTFHRTYQISLGKIAFISTAFFFTQLLIDLFCAKYVDKIGYRKSVVASEILSAAGLIGLAFLPSLLPDPYVGILISVIIYAMGSGLIEVLVSPIVEACPFDNKDSVMSLLHSFYCWGSVGVILLSTIFFAIFGIENWRILSCIWALAQWASAYVESALGISKNIGDIIGPCLFAIMMGISRFFYGKYGEKLDLMKFMIASGILCLICYLLAALAPLPFLNLVGCSLCGFSVGIMWPGTISIASKKIPLGGTAMFAFLAMAGDLGGAVGPGIVGLVTQAANDNLKIGVLAGCVFPAVLVLSVLLLKRKREKV